MICRDTASFKQYFPDVKNYIGNFDFGLNRSGESIRLFNNDNMPIDSVNYRSRHPWPIMPDGGGPTLSLKNPDMDNVLPVSWTASKNHGTPGAKNDNYIELSINPSSQIPNEFQLYPNYPNPFNATTTISYQLAEPALVNISIYNVRGQFVKVLVNENKQPGYHLIRWEARNLTSGIYLYRISAGQFSASGKCLLLK